MAGGERRHIGLENARRVELDKGTGAITGIPTKRSATSSFTVEVRDTKSTTRPHTRNTASASFTITIS
ncbi:MAG: hypothetical protein IVW52_09115 [Acidimicrobiales bacterium]|nr:hypothetical protein [Acidimicrobiales bacterium]